jgi:nicotinamide-nucleotide amidase
MHSAIACPVCLSRLPLKTMKISVLGVGTELTNGQILNRNAQWISQEMSALGVTTAMHLVVPDEKSLILQALDVCAKNSDILFVTGGLGPTSDDFTREVIAQWVGRDLIWHEASWKHIEDRLLPRGISVKEIQRQQCYYPTGSEVLMNRLGTANAFRLDHDGKTLFVLPGPPREIESLWQDHIAQFLSEKTKGVDRLITLSWDTIGLGESDVADRVEEALKGCHFEKGYRVHMPFVEVKLSFLKSEETQAQKWIQALDLAIGPLTVLRNGEDAAEKLAGIFSSFEHVFIQDEIPGSFLLQRLFPSCKELLREKKLSFSSQDLDPNLPPRSLYLNLKVDSANSGRALMDLKGQTRSQIFMSPYKSSLLKEREQQFYAEMALIFWMKELAHEHLVSLNPSQKP